MFIPLLVTFYLGQVPAGGVMEGHDTFLQLKSQLTRGQIEEGNRRALDAIRRRNAGRP